MQKVKQLPGTSASHVGALDLSLNYSVLLIQLFANTWEAAEYETVSGTPVTHMGDMDSITGSWLRLGPALALFQAFGE